jgi:hypothetical protein
MKNKTTTDTATFPIEGLPKSELLVSYNAKMSMTPSRIEECHGVHEFNDNDICVEVTRVEISIFGRGVEITRQLTEKEIKALAENIQPIF